MSGLAPLVHLVDPLGPGASRWLAALSGKVCPGDVVSIGQPGPVACGHRVPVSSSRAATIRTLERVLDDLAPCAVVAWGTRAAGLACEARDAASRWLVVDGVPDTPQVPFDAEVVCLGDTVADAISRAGWPPMRLRVVTPPPPVAAMWCDESVRAERRRRWCAGPDTTVVGLLPAGPGEGDAMAALDVVGRAHLAGVDARLVLHPETGGAAAMQVFARRAGLRDRVHFEDSIAEVAAHAGAIDVWLSLPDPRVDGTALDACVAGGLGGCLMAVDGSLAASAAERGVDAIVASDRNALAAELVSLAEAPQRRAEIAAAARARHATAARLQAFRSVLDEAAARAGIAAANPAAASA